MWRKAEESKTLEKNGLCPCRRIERSSGQERQVRGRVAQMRLEQDAGPASQGLPARQGAGLYPKKSERPWRLLKRMSYK